MADIFLPEVDSSEEREYIFRGFANPSHCQRNSTNECSHTQVESETKTDEDENEKSKGDMKDNKDAELADNQMEINDTELNSNEIVDYEDKKTNQDVASDDEKDNCGSESNASSCSTDSQLRSAEESIEVESNNNEKGAEESAESTESSKEETDSKENESKDDKNEGSNSESNMDIDDMFSFPPPSVGLLLSDLEGLADSEFIHHRQLAVKKILDCLRRSGSNQEHLQLVISVMCRLSDDEESMVRSELVQHIPSIALFCQGHSAGLKRVIRQQLVPYTVKLLNDSQIGVRKLGQSALLVLLEDGLIDQSQLTEWICPLVSQLTVSENSLEGLRTEDVTVMTRMIPFVGRDATVKFFLEPYISLCSDLAFEIRKICAMGFGVLCRMVGTETTESSLLRVFQELCNDAVWGVRKACADVFAEVAAVVSLKTRKEVLPDIFINLLNDYSQYVKYAGYQSLGSFIYTFADPSQTGLAFVDGKLVELPSLAESLASNVAELPPSETPCLESSDNGSKCDRLCKDEDVWVGFKELRKCVGRTKEKDSIAVTSKDEHLYLHIDNENIFNNFQFWRTPLPEVELDIDMDGGKATNIHIRAKVPGSSGGPACTSEIKVRIAPSEMPDLESVQNGSSDSKASKMQVQTACISTITPSSDQNQSQVDLDVLNSSYQRRTKSFEARSKMRVVVVDDPSQRAKVNYQMSPYDQDLVPPELLSRFISVAHQHFPVYDFNKQCDEERIGYCAYSFPAVAFTLGRKNWPCLQNTCEKLAKDTKWTIRKTIASSLHELAAILGHDLTARDLFPIFLDLMKDVDEVRMKLIMHLYEFLKQLQPEWRKMFLPFVEEFGEVDNDRNWRFRCTVAEQLKPTVQLFDSLEIMRYFLPIALGYVQDKVSAVRIAAVQLVAVIVRHMMNGDTKYHVPPLLDKFDVRHRQAYKWVGRQTYVLLCEQLAVQKSVPAEMYAKLIAPNLFFLAWDSVPNVRIALSRCIAVTLVPHEYLPIIQKENHNQLIEVMLTLLRDVDEDVRYFAGLHASLLPE